MASATGASTRHKNPSWRAAHKKTNADTSVKPHAKRADSRPAGKCRFAVRRFRASMSASRIRLNVMAAERAATIATMIQAKRRPKSFIWNPASRQASSAPVKANGNANTECSNLIMSSVRRSRLQKRAISFFENATILLGHTDHLRTSTMNAHQLQQLLEEVRDGRTTVDAAVDTLRHLPFEDLGFAKVDHHRRVRHGMSEVILGQGKDPEQVAGIAAALLAKSPNLLLTRATEEMAARVAALAPETE